MEQKVAQYLALKKEFGIEIDEDDFVFLKYTNADERYNDTPDVNGFDDGWLTLDRETKDGKQVHYLVKFRPLVTAEDRERLRRRFDPGDYVSWYTLDPWERIIEAAVRAFLAPG